MNAQDREEFAVMKNEVLHIKDDLATNTKQHKELKDMIEKFIASADKKYAPKYATILALGSFLTALSIIITLIIK